MEDLESKTEKIHSFITKFFVGGLIVGSIGAGVGWVIQDEYIFNNANGFLGGDAFLYTAYFLATKIYK